MKTKLNYSMLEELRFLFVDKVVILTGLGILSFSNFMIVLFGQTIPNVIWSFFKDVGEVVVVTSVFLFAFMWILKARPHKRPKKYEVVIYDIFGKESPIDGIRTDFKTHDVAWSFMKSYKKSYPLYNFALVSDSPKSEKKTIFKYI